MSSDSESSDEEEEQIDSKPTGVFHNSTSAQQAPAANMTSFAPSPTSSNSLASACDVTDASLNNNHSLTPPEHRTSESSGFNDKLPTVDSNGFYPQLSATLGQNSLGSGLADIQPDIFTAPPPPYTVPSLYHSPPQLLNARSSLASQNPASGFDPFATSQGKLAGAFPHAPLGHSFMSQPASLFPGIQC